VCVTVGVTDARAAVVFYSMIELLIDLKLAHLCADTIAQLTLRSHRQQSCEMVCAFRHSTMSDQLAGIAFYNRLVHDIHNESTS